MKDRLKIFCKTLWQVLKQKNFEWFFGLYFLLGATIILFTKDLNQVDAQIAFWAMLNLSYVLYIGSKILSKLDNKTHN